MSTVDCQGCIGLRDKYSTYRYPCVALITLKSLSSPCKMMTALLSHTICGKNRLSSCRYCTYKPIVSMSDATAGLGEAEEHTSLVSCASKMTELEESAD